MNLICFGHLPWSPLWKRNQSMVFNLKQLGSFDRILFITRCVKITNFIFKLKLPINDIVEIHHLKSVIPRRVSKDIVSLATIIAGPAYAFSKLNNWMSNFYIYFIKRFRRKGKFHILINDFNPERMVFYKTLLPLAEKVIVDISDDFLSFGDKEKRIKKIKETLDYCIKKANIVLCVNKAIFNKYNDKSGKFYIFKNGISFGVFRKEINTKDPFLKLNINHPIIGYMGWIARNRIDIDILDKVQANFRNCSIVFLGQDIEQFCKGLRRRYSNFYYLPAVPYETMARYIKYFDVAIIAHKVNECTAGNSLLKAYAFMAARVPVVATDVSELVEFKEIIDIAKDKEEFCRLVENNLRAKDPLRLEKGFRVAEENDWPAKLNNLLKAIEIGF
jgi:hypothetical protein